MKPLFTLSALLLLILSATAEPLTVSVVDRGNMAHTTEAVQQVITTEDAWVEAWKQIHGGVEPLPERPDIEFTKSSVIVLVDEARNTGGYGIEIASVDTTDDGVVVSYKCISPPEGSMNIMVITRPWLVAVIPTVDADTVTFKDVTE
jgi:hypothetical protein